MLIVPEKSRTLKVGQVAGSRKVLGIEFYTRHRPGSSAQRWVVVECKCGKIQAVQSIQLTRLGHGSCRNCGQTTHGKSKRSFYGQWRNILTRCENPKSTNYASYGGRGIRVCEEWKTFEAFESWAISSGYKPGLTIEREDVNGNYEPKNCTWATRIEQSRNKRTTIQMTAFGETRLLIDWAGDARCKVGLRSLYYRFHSGWDHELAITLPSTVRT